MYCYTFRGKVYEISETQLRYTIKRYVEGYIVLADLYHHLHISGFPDWRGTFRQPDKGQYELEKTIANLIDDAELSEAYTSLKNQLHEIEELDRQKVKWLAGYVGLSLLEDKKDISRLQRKLRKIVVNGPDGHPQGPIWVLQPEYQVFVEKSKSILTSIYKIQGQIEHRIQELEEKASQNEKE